MCCQRGYANGGFHPNIHCKFLCNYILQDICGDAGFLLDADWIYDLLHDPLTDCCPLLPSLNQIKRFVILGIKVLKDIL